MWEAARKMEEYTQVPADNRILFNITGSTCFSQIRLYFCGVFQLRDLTQTAEALMDSDS
jgi:hypothetical protein